MMNTLTKKKNGVAGITLLFMCTICIALPSGSLDGVCSIVEDNEYAVPLMKEVGIIRPYWYETWGESADDWIMGIAVSGESIFAAGTSYNSDVSHGFLLKFSTDGELEWEKSLIDENATAANDVVCADGYIYVTGATDGENLNIFLSKYDINGTRIWTKTWGGSSLDVAKGMTIYNGNIYLVGTSRSFGALSSDLVVVKFDTDGVFKWFKLYGGLDAEEGSGIVATENGIYAAGMTETYDLGGGDSLLIRFDMNGEVIWAKTYGDTAAEWATDVIEHEEFIYVTGFTNSYVGPIFLLKYDQEGDMLWERRWGSADGDRGLAITAYENTIYVAGETFGEGNGGADICLLKYDTEGVLSWVKTWGGDENDIPGALKVDEERIYIAGSTGSFGDGSGDNAFLLKCNLEGKRSKSFVAGIPFLAVPNHTVVCGGRLVASFSMQSISNTQEPISCCKT